MSAFESSPVHCLKPRPWGNLLSPENGGASAILPDLELVYCTQMLHIRLAFDLSHRELHARADQSGCPQFVV